MSPSKVIHSAIPAGCGGVVGLRKVEEENEKVKGKREKGILWCLFSARGDVGPKKSYLISSGSSRSCGPQRPGLVEELSS